MTKVAKPLSYLLAPGLLLLSALLTGWDWYLEPGRREALTFAALMLGLMTCVFVVCLRKSRDEGIVRRAADSIVSGIVFAGLMMASVLAVKLSRGAGAIDSSDLAQRFMMVITGAFLAFTGNAMPKTLAPLAPRQCNEAKIQTFHRLAGWTWVLTGLALSTAWLVAPVRVASLMTFPLIMTSGLIILALVLRLRRSDQEAK